MGIVRVCKQHNFLEVRLVMTDNEKILKVLSITKTRLKSFKHKIQTNLYMA